MGRIVRKLNTFMLSDFEYMQSWLEDQAREGLLLIKSGQFIMRFEKGEPVERKYQLAPYTGKMDKEDLHSFESRGWRRVPGQQLNIFFSDERDAIRPKRTLSNYKDLRQDILFGMLLVIALNIMALGFLSLMNLDSETLEAPMHILANVTYIVFIFSTAFVIFFLVSSSMVVIKALVFFNRVNQSALIRENLDYRRKRMLGSIGRILTVLVIVSMIYAIATSFGQSDITENVNRGEVSYNVETPVNPQLISFEKLYPDEWNIFIKDADNEKMNKDNYKYYYRTAIGPFFKVYLQHFYTKKLEYTTSKLAVASNEDSAEKYLEEEIDFITYEKKPTRKIIKAKGIDYACTGKTEIKEYFVAGRNGRKVMVIKSFKKSITDKKYIDRIMELFRKTSAEN